jgi:hypothetical protein
MADPPINTRTTGLPVFQYFVQKINWVEGNFISVRSPPENPSTLTGISSPSRYGLSPRNKMNHIRFAGKIHSFFLQGLSDLPHKRCAWGSFP